MKSKHHSSKACAENQGFEKSSWKTRPNCLDRRVPTTRMNVASTSFWLRKGISMTSMRMLSVTKWAVCTIDKSLTKTGAKSGCFKRLSSKMEIFIPTTLETENLGGKILMMTISTYLFGTA